jgi:nitrilase
VFALTVEGTRRHVMSWSNHFPTSGDLMRSHVVTDSQTFAKMSKAWVISACGKVDEDIIRKLEVGPEDEKFLRNPDCCGGSAMVASNSRIVAGPMAAKEGILYAECNLEVGINMRLRQDFVGHYNRPDIFQPHVNRSAPHVYTVYGSNEAPTLGTPDAVSRLPDMASRAIEGSAHEDLIGGHFVEKLPETDTVDLQHVKRK